MSNIFGRKFQILTFGESHGKATGVVIDGCPANIPLDLKQIQTQVNRRKPGQSAFTTARNEPDEVLCVSGLEGNLTLGSPLCFMVYNEDKKPNDYKKINKIFRPSHADYTYQLKYGIRASSGGGRASARETLGRVIAGAVAEEVLRHLFPKLKILAYVSSIQKIQSQVLNQNTLSRELIDKSPLRCPDEQANEKMEDLINEAIKDGDSLGGVISAVILNPPTKLGEPVFGKIEAELAKAMLSIPATKGFEIGSGFFGTTLYGSEHNDAFISTKNGIKTKTNNSGGVQGGITNGEPITFSVAFKPTASIGKKQDSVDEAGNAVELEVIGRHDACVLPRAVPIVEAMSALVILDQFLLHYGYENSF